MRSKVLVGVATAMMLSVFVIASIPASALSTTIPSGATFTFRIPVLDGDRISFDWVADLAVTFSITDPNGDSVYSFSGAVRVGHIDATMTGEYSLHWTNNHASSVGLEYNVTTSTFEHLSGPLLAAIIGVIVVIIIVIIVVVLVVLVAKPKARAQQGPGTYSPYGPPGAPPPQMAGQYVGPPTPEGKCPRCGSAVSPDAAFCLKCGARLR